MSEHVVGDWVHWYTDTGEANGVSYARSAGALGNAWSDDMLDDVVSDGVWTAGPDDVSDEPEISMPVSQWAELWRKARAYDRLVEGGKLG